MKFNNLIVLIGFILHLKLFEILLNRLFIFIQMVYYANFYMFNFVSLNCFNMFFNVIDYYIVYI